MGNSNNVKKKKVINGLGITVFCIVLLSCFANPKLEKNKKNDNNYLELLTKKQGKFWDLFTLPKRNVYGRGFCFYSDGRVIDYNYDKLKHRIITDYDDVIIDKLTWKINIDTLFIGNIYKYKILKLNKDTLELIDLYQTGGVTEKLLFLKSKDQVTKPIQD
jgi:hypothetical protein